MPGAISLMVIVYRQICMHSETANVLPNLSNASEVILSV